MNLSAQGLSSFFLPANTTEILQNASALTFTGTTKLAASNWGKGNEDEGVVIIR
jgi:hypothetical protein